MKIFLSLGVESGLRGVYYELAEHPLAQLAVRALLRLAEREAQGFKLGGVERAGQVVEQVLRSATLSLAYGFGILREHVGEYLHLRPDVVVDEPFHKRSHRLGSRLVVQGPEQASGLPCRHERTLRHVPQRVVVGQVSKRSHISRQIIHQLIERLDDEAPFADGETGDVFIETLEKRLVILALSRNP